MKKISIAILALITVLVSCKKVPEVNLKYVDVERDLITVGMTTATVQCDYQYIATLKKAYFYYGEGENEADMNTAEMRVVQNTLYVDLADLKPNTLYSYYYEFYNGFNSMRTVVKTFKTESLPIALPTVVTSLVSEITTNSAKGGGEVTDDGGAEVTERGICWSTNENPTLNDNHVAAGTGTGVFTATMTGLEVGVTYHVRAYAVNEKGRAYGLDREFTTNSIEGALSGDFSVSETEKVRFSKGNLQYRASTNTWRFAENQWDYVGEGNTNASASYDGWIDLFSWGTSGYDHGATCYQPWYITWQSGQFDHAAYAQNSFYLGDDNGQADWGYNAISNGGNQEMQWHTLTNAEWDYIFNNRNTATGIRYAKAVVNEVNGVVLLPDNWDMSIFALNNTNNETASYDVNTISQEAWSNVMEPNGAVFLPAAGIMQIWADNDFGIRGAYYTASSVAPWLKGSFEFNNEICGLSHEGGIHPLNNCSVRLVLSAQSTSNIEVVINKDGSGMVSGGGSCVNGQAITLTATPSAGYTFLYWRENGRVVSFKNPYTFPVGRNRQLEACFNEVSLYPLVYSFNESEHTASVIDHWDGQNASGELVIPEVVSYLGETYTVTAIGQNGLQVCNGLVSVEIPSSLTEIGNNGLGGCFLITSITIHAEVPPVLGYRAVVDIDKSIPVYIPNGSLSAYQNAEGWNEFTNFIEMP